MRNILILFLLCAFVSLGYAQSSELISVSGKVPGDKKVARQSELLVTDARDDKPVFTTWPTLDGDYSLLLPSGRYNLYLDGEYLGNVRVVRIVSKPIGNTTYQQNQNINTNLNNQNNNPYNPGYRPTPNPPVTPRPPISIR